MVPLHLSLESTPFESSHAMVLSDQSDVFGTPDIPMIQSKLPSRINKDVLPSNKKKDAYKSSSDL